MATTKTKPARITLLEAKALYPSAFAAAIAEYGWMEQELLPEEEKCELEFWHADGVLSTRWRL